MTRRSPCWQVSESAHFSRWLAPKDCCWPSPCWPASGPFAKRSAPTRSRFCARPDAQRTPSVLQPTRLRELLHRLLLLFGELVGHAHVDLHDQIAQLVVLLDSLSAYAKALAA